MELNVQGRNVAVQDRFKEYAQKKSERFAQLGDKVQSIDVKVTQDHANSGHQGLRVEITVIGRGPVVRAEARNSDKFAAFDEAYAKLVEQLRRARDRRKVHRGGTKRPVAVHEATGSLPVARTTARRARRRRVPVPLSTSTSRSPASRPRPRTVAIPASSAHLTWPASS